MATMGSRTYSDTSRTNFNRYVRVLWTLTRPGKKSPRRGQQRFRQPLTGPHEFVSKRLQVVFSSVPLVGMFRTVPA
jgi:hypothetical protein